MEGTGNGAPVALAFDNMMQDRAIGGTTAWTGYEVVLAIPTAATAIAFGALLVGPGRLWVDQFTFEEVTTAVPSATFLSRPRFWEHPETLSHTVPHPTNLGFED